MEDCADVFREIPFDKIPEVLNTLRKDFPQSIHTYYFIDNYTSWRHKTDRVSLKVYCPDGNTGDGIVLAVATYTNDEYFYSVHCVDETSCRRLHDVLKRTTLIKWSRVVLFEAAHEKIVPTLRNVVQEKGHRVFSGDEYAQVWLPPAKAKLLTEVTPPEGFHIKKLESQHAEIVNKYWAYARAGSEEFVRDTIILNEGVGLFTDKNDALVAWNTVQHFRGLGMLYTLEEYRKKGYASLVTRALSKILSDKNIDPYACILTTNQPSLTTFAKLGFERICSVYWMACRLSTNT